MDKLEVSKKSGPLERYTQILEAISASTNGLSSRELATVLDLPKTTVNRLLHGLAASELVRRSGSNGSYLIGNRLRRILESDTAWVITASKKRLKALADETGETCFIARLFGAEIRSVIMESPDASVGVYVTPGYALPPHATASGKLLTAFQEPGLRDAILQTGLQRLTRQTLLDREALQAEYDTILKQGHSTENGEHVEGLFTIACPIWLSPDNPPIYALGLTGPSARVGGSGLPSLISKLKKATDDIARVFLPTVQQIRRA